MRSLELRIYIKGVDWEKEGATVFGEWVDLPIPYEKAKSFEDDDSPIDYFITDSESNIEGLRITERTSIIELNSTADDLEKLDGDDIKKLNFLVRDEGMNFDKALGRINDVSFYAGAKLRDVAQDLIDNGAFGTVERSLLPYIDYGALGDDLRHDGYTENDDGVFQYGDN